MLPTAEPGLKLTIGADGYLSGVLIDGIDLIDWIDITNLGRHPDQCIAYGKTLPVSECPLKKLGPNGSILCHFIFAASQALQAADNECNYFAGDGGIYQDGVLLKTTCVGSHPNMLPPPVPTRVTLGIR